MLEWAARERILLSVHYEKSKAVGTLKNALVHFNKLKCVFMCVCVCVCVYFSSNVGLCVFVLYCVLVTRWLGLYVGAGEEAWGTGESVSPAGTLILGHHC